MKYSWRKLDIVWLRFPLCIYASAARRLLILINWNSYYAERFRLCVMVKVAQALSIVAVESFSDVKVEESETTWYLINSLSLDISA